MQILHWMLCYEVASVVTVMFSLVKYPPTSCFYPIFQNNVVYLQTVSFNQWNRSMGRIMAFDYGKKRIGVAVTDPMQMIANALDTVSPNEVYAFLDKYLATEPVDMFVVGLPKKMNNDASDSMRQIEPFVRSLKHKYPTIPVEMYDERFTSVLAHQAMLAGGVKKKERRENKELVDRVSATIILQSFLESRQFKMK